MKEVNQSIDNLHETIQEADIPEEHQDVVNEVTDHIEKIKEAPEAGHHHGLKKRLDEAIFRLDTRNHDLVESMRAVILNLDAAGL